MSVLNYITLSHLKKVVAGVAQKFKEIEGKINKTNIDITAINNNITSVNEEIGTIKEGKLIKRGSGTESEIFNSETENDAYLLVSSASGNYSHSGGYFGEANGNYSYAEGTDFYSSGFYLKLTSSGNAGISFTVSNVVGHDNGIWNANKFPSLINHYLQVGPYTIRKVVNEQKTDGIITSITIDSPFYNSNIISNKDVYLIGCIANGLSSYAKGTQAFAMGDYSHAEGYAVLSYGEYSYAQGNYVLALNTFTHAEGYGTTASGSDSSHAEGYQTTASGNYGAHAEGYQTTASGNNGDHAEGYRTTASGGNGAHSEGYGTIASGYYSHSEGDLTIASSTACHAEGRLSRATAADSHAEGTYGSFSVLLTGNADAVTYSVGSAAPYIYGNNFVIGARITNPNGAITTNSHVVVAATNTNGYLTSITLDKTLDSSSSVSKSYTLHIGTLASGTGSHAEGAYTHTIGYYSHAEGIGTVAVTHYQHAQGKYNIIDNNYADIVGNGSGVNNRSNAYTLDWDGNGWYAGKLTVGIAPTNNMDVATKKYVDDAIPTVPTKVSDLTNDSGFITSYTETDPIFVASAAHGITSSDITNWNSKTSNTGTVTQVTAGTGLSIGPTAGGNFTTSGTINHTNSVTAQNTQAIYPIKIDAQGHISGYGSAVTPLTASSTLDATKLNGTVPTACLPSYVDDVLEYSAKSNFPATGESGKIYVDTTTNLTYRWSGSAYVEISPSLALGTTSSTAFRGDYGNSAYTHAVTNKGSAFSSGLYKITTNSEGHVTAATSVEKSDITDLGIPAQDTTYTFDGTYNSSTNKAATVSTVTNAVSGKANSSDVLTKTNTTSYTPTANYHPATKKYVDDVTAGITSNLSGLTDTTITTPTDGQLLRYNSTTSKWENVTLSLAISGNTIQLKEGNTVISSVTLPIYNGGVSS